jgi:hypothetical protein
VGDCGDVAREGLLLNSGVKLRDPESLKIME